MTSRIACRHSLDTIAGFRVVKTLDGGEVLDRPKVSGRFEGATSYGLAVEACSVLRRPRGAWAVVDTRYLCGCWSTERENLRASIGRR